MAQLGRLFGPAALLPRSYEEVDWTRERLSSTAQDEAPPKVLPAYGHPLLRDPALDGRLFWAGAETSPLEGGLLGSAVQSGEHAARLVLTRRAAEGRGGCRSGRAGGGHSHPAMRVMRAATLSKGSQLVTSRR
ncbi:FAD-dependent oxidoreductase [Deinococcus malanensis]|nr:FAD-dependent oxidoreductase [Deinococcus malanensis]